MNTILEQIQNHETFIMLDSTAYTNKQQLIDMMELDGYNYMKSTDSKSTHYWFKLGA